MESRKRIVHIEKGNPFHSYVFSTITYMNAVIVRMNWKQFASNSDYLRDRLKNGDFIEDRDYERKFTRFY